MGAYSYKEVMYRGDFQKAIKPCMESCGATESDYDGDANYDGDAWIVTAFLLEHKDAELVSLTARVRELEAALRPFVADGIEQACDECGGDDAECPEDCAVRVGRAALGE